MGGRNGSVLVLTAVLMWSVNRLALAAFDPVLVQIVYLLGFLGLAMILIGLLKRMVGLVTSRTIAAIDRLAASHVLAEQEQPPVAELD